MTFMIFVTIIDKVINAEMEKRVDIVDISVLIFWLYTSAGTLLKIYRRLIGRPYLSTRSAAPNISQYIGSTWQACNTSLQCIVE